MIKLTNSAAPSDTHPHTHIFTPHVRAAQLTRVILIGPTFIHHNGYVPFRRHAYTRDVLCGGDGERL